MEINWQPEYNVFLLLLSSLVAVTSEITENDSTPNPSQSGTISDVQDNVGLRWPMGVVTYYLDNHAYDNFVSDRIRTAMNTLESASCMRFKRTLIKPPGNITWIHITNPSREQNCVHEPIYKKGGEIVLVIGFDCLKNREILHTLLHAIGFKDEVTHPHRDQYIRVLWNNIRPEYRHLYRIQADEEMTSTLLVEYDPSSVMHFHDRAFTINGRATLLPLIPGLQISPSLSGLSQLDKMRLRLLFDRECNKRTVGSVIDTCKMVLSNNMNVKDDIDVNGKDKNKSTGKDSIDNYIEDKPRNNNESIAEDDDDDGGDGDNAAGDDGDAVGDGYDAAGDSDYAAGDAVNEGEKKSMNSEINTGDVKLYKMIEPYTLKFEIEELDPGFDINYRPSPRWTL